MKSFFTLILLAIVPNFILAQVPEAFSYQAVIRDDMGGLVQDKVVSIKISILQNSIDGEVVYSERHAAITNTNGLISIQIGKGNNPTSTFSEINWSIGSYFIETAIDLSGGTNFKTIGTSELLSVPFALHAKTAENASVSKRAILADSVLNLPLSHDLSSLASKTSLNDSISNLRNEIPRNTSELTNDSGFLTSEDSATTYSVGDFAKGGIVFWVDETGQHGLVTSKVDQSNGTTWYAGSFITTQAKGDGVYAGKSNTTIIISTHAAIGDNGNSYAARICHELKINEGGINYGDWYLPSIEELILMYENLTTINETAVLNGGNNLSGFYWSSTESDANHAWRKNFDDGYQDGQTKKAIASVRAIRAF